MKSLQVLILGSKISYSGLVLTLVSLLYLMEPLFKVMGKNVVVAVMTVVVVMEFTVGKQFSLTYYYHVFRSQPHWLCSAISW